ncbi:MAG: hypothetical protein JW990_02455, partial [Thermoleophilia bacterium]|nr:hypothetical protein [Thermoleophilia bacterium]
MKRLRSSKTAAGAGVLLAVVLMLSLAACGDEPRETTTTTAAASSAEVQVAMSELARLAPAASATDVGSVADSVKAFGTDLYEILAAGAGAGNLVFSPSSIVTALAMTYA